MSRIWIRIIAILEIVGGVFGIVFILSQVVAVQNNRVTLVIASMTFAVCTLSLIAGITLFLNHPFGRIGSIVVQFIQLPKYSSQILVFMFSFGFDGYPYLALTDTANIVVGFEFKFLAFYQLFVNPTDVPVIFGVSIPASIFLAMLFNDKRRAANRPEQLADESDRAKTHDEPSGNRKLTRSG